MEESKEEGRVKMVDMFKNVLQFYRYDKSNGGQVCDSAPIGL